MRHLIAVAALALAACDVPQDTAVPVSSDPAVEVKRIAEVDGCVIYNVRSTYYEGGMFVRCPLSSVDAAWDERRGKIRVHRQVTTTEGQ